jgi:peptide/nickel transport system substrate-binding protein
MWAIGRRLVPILTACLAASGISVAAASAETVLRLAPHSDLKIVDPIWGTALITFNHGNLIYDTLFALDERLEPKPQMVDKWEVSPDKLTWTFFLRDGIAWHDGAPVTGEDVVASIKRWSGKGPLAQRLSAATAELTAPDARSVRLVLKQPYGLVLQTLANPSAFVMPKRVADISPNTQISDTTGSGPFIFKKEEWKPGERVAYVRNPAYRPRSEPPSGLAGGKIAKVDRIEWIWIPDAQTQVNALLQGEVDMVETVPPDLLPLIASDKKVKAVVLNTAGRLYTLRFNVLHKPFDDARIRQAVLYALDQKPFLDANVGNPELYKLCKLLFPCGTPLESTKGWEEVLSGNTAKARQILQEAGYDGTPIVLLHQTDLAGHTNLATVARSQLEAAGFKVDLQAMDWQTLVSRRAKKEPLDKGGWSAFLTSWGAADVLDPVSTPYLVASCDKAMQGWPCDARLEELRDAFAGETDPVKRKAIAEQVQLRVVEYPTHVPLGQFTTASAIRSNVSGLLHAPWLALWNVEKK